jgi:glyoxylase-like metal-dependent hydrolase (beta-lactamase superfamily II)
MKRRIVGSLLAALPLAASVALGQAHPLETTVEGADKMLIREDLGDGVFVFRAPSDLEYWTATNSVVIVNDDDVAVFDSCTRAVTAKAVIGEIRRLTDKPVRVLINSHWHQDHWSGNEEYTKAFPGVRIIASAETRAYMEVMGSAFFVRELEQFGLSAMREDLAAALRTGRLADGSPLTAAARARKEASIRMASQFAAEVAALPRVLPNVVYRNDMTFWSGRRELRLMSVTGDATGSTVLYLPGSRILVTGDVLVSPEDGKGPPPWTTNSYAITPWLESLRRLDALGAAAIVPGQGPVMHDGTYLRRTIDLFAAVLDQVHSALGRGVYRMSELQAAVDVDRIAREYAPGVPPGDEYRRFLAKLTTKAAQEALDGAELK